MARQYTDSFSGQVLIVPDSSVTINVISQPSSLSSSGIVALVGEADEGPQWTEESPLSNNVFGAGDLSRVQAKYGSGPLVDGFQALIGATSSPQIQGSFSQCILVKTNPSTAAAKITNDGSGNFTALIEGEGGNSIMEQISTNQAEIAPSTGAFSYVPSASSMSLALRVNGGAVQTASIAANTTPAALAAELSALANVNAVGGINTSITTGLSPSNNIAVTVAGQSVNVTLASPGVFGNAPQVGDTLNIPSGSVIAGAGSANVGWYVVTGAVNSTALAQITATKITAGAPVAVASVALSATPANDLVEYSSISINNMSGTNRNILAGLVGQDAVVTAAGSSLTLTLAGSSVFAALPKIGDTLYIPSSSAFVGAADANAGWYQVTAASNYIGSAFITALRISNGTPVAVATTAIAAVSDVQDLLPQIRGVGKTMEIKDNGGSANVSTAFLQLGATASVPWLGEEQVSAAELIDAITLTQSNPLVTQVFNVGGDIALTLGYAGTTATATISVASNGVKTLATSVVGGVGANLSINLSKYNSINDLVTYINLQPGYSASANSAQAGLLNPQTVLDAVSAMGICSSVGGQPGRIKQDVYDTVVAPGGLASSNLVSYQNILLAGLPENEGPVFLSGGTRGGTTGLQFSQAIDALAAITTNFVVTCVSQDASADILQGNTDPSSTYAIDAVNAALKAHVLAMSTAKVKKHRIGFASKLGSFVQAQEAAAQMSTYRIALTFQEVNDLNSQGGISTFQPWYAGAKAAGIQAAGFYKSIFNKAVSVSAVIDPSDFDSGVQSEMEEALLSNLLPLQLQPDGTITFVSDQTTYGIDDNFVYNSIQAVYVSDIIALDLALSLKQAFVGQSVADVTPSVAVSFIKSKMAQYLNDKLIVGNSQYPAGWTSIQVTISQGVMSVQAVAILATCIYYVPIALDIEGLTESASA